MRPLLLGLLIVLASCSIAGAQSAGGGTSSRTHEQRPTLRRTMISATVGVSTAAIFAGSTQRGPTAQVAVQQRVTNRIALGLALGRATVVGTPFVDNAGVGSTLTRTTTHVGARLRGTFVRAGNMEVYGGLQLGLNLSSSRQSHDFPEAMAGENQDAYIARRTSPFAEDANQLRPVGFIGAAFQVVRGVSFVTEIGNNLAIGQAGLEVQF